MTVLSQQRLIDPLIAVALGCAAFLIGGSYARLPAVTASASYYQETFGPAVMLGCGRGLSPTADLAPLPALQDFLERRADAFECGALPADLGGGQLTALQSASRYLMSVVGLAWMAGGVSWSGLWWFFGLLFATVAALAYAAARLMLNRWLAAGVSLALMTSSMQLGALPHLRDYSKAPFFTAMAVITLAVLLRPMTPRALYGWSALAGSLIGIAFGVRFDMTLFLAIFVGAVMVCAPGRLRAEWHRRVTAVAICMAAFILLALPVLLSFELGNNSWHVIILGLAEPHQAALDLHRPAYHLGTLYNDSFIAATVNSHWQQTRGTTALLPLNTPEYGAAAADYFREVARQFPADMVMRAWAATLKLFRLPLEGSTAAPSLIDAEGVIGAVLGARATTLSWIDRIAPWVAVIPIAALIVLARFHLKAALLGLGACLFLGGMSSLQFQARHIFHLELIALLLIAAAVQFAIAWFARRRANQPAAHGRSWRPVVAIALSLVVLMTVPTWALRGQQQSSARELFTSYGAAVAAATPTFTASDNGMTLVAAANADPEGAALRTQLFAADFGGSHCDYDQVAGTIRYRATSQAADFSRPFVVAIPPATATTRMWFTVYQLRDGQPNRNYVFSGIEIPTARASCLAALGRVTDLRALPLLVDAELEPGWEASPLYLTLRGFETAPAGPATTYPWPLDAAFTRSELSRPLATPGTGPDFVARIVNVQDTARLTAQGIAPPVAYLASWPATSPSPSSLLIAAGELTSGSVVIGLERDGAWAVQVPIHAPGPYRVAIRPPGPGAYRVVIANNRPAGTLWTSFSVDRIGWTE